VYKIIENTKKQLTLKEKSLTDQNGNKLEEKGTIPYEEAVNDQVPRGGF
jgi:hypothetical protein